MCIRSIAVFHIISAKCKERMLKEHKYYQFIKGLFLYTILCNDIIVAKCYEHFLNVEQSADNLSYLFKCAKCLDVIV